MAVSAKTPALLTTKDSMPGSTASAMTGSSKLVEVRSGLDGGTLESIGDSGGLLSVLVSLDLCKQSGRRHTSDSDVVDSIGGSDVVLDILNLGTSFTTATVMSGFLT